MGEKFHCTICVSVVSSPRGKVSLGSSSNRLKVDYWCTTEITTWRMSFREMVNGPSFILSLAFRSATPEKRKRQIRFLQKICWKRSSRTCQRPKSCGQLKANAHWQEAWRGIHLRTRKTEKARETWDTLSRIQNYSWLLHQRGLCENIKRKVAKMPGILFCLKNVWSGQEKSKFYDTLKVGQPGTKKNLSTSWESLERISAVF